MKATLYEMQIVDGAMDMVHGVSHTITELHLYSHDIDGRPLDVGINTYQDELHVNESASDSGRYSKAKKLRELPWDEDMQKLAAQIQVLVGLRAEIRKRLGFVIEK